MKSLCGLGVFFLVLCIAESAFSQSTATTDDGRKVRLKADGTWEYIADPVQNDSQVDFRKTKWGMSRAQVKQREPGKVERDDDSMLIYSGTVSTMDALIIYVFVDDKLVRARYAFTEKHSNENDFISDFQSIKTTLVQKYGDPHRDDVVWRNDLYKGDSAHWGFAVSLGHLVYICEWDAIDTSILLGLSGENYDVSLITEYASRQLAHLEEEAKRKKGSSDF